MKVDTYTYTMIYAVVLGVVCAAMLTAAGQFAAPYKEANAKADEMRHVLTVLRVPFDPKSTAAKLAQAFEQNVRGRDRGGMSVYEYVASDGKMLAQAVPFAGPGVWGPMRGFLALGPDGVTIVEVSFYEQEETPGLGGEIGSKWFQDQFQGRRIVDAQNRPGIRIRRDGAKGSNEVDGIAGATMTCDKVEIMLNETIQRLLKERKNNDRNSQ
ncbi:MAG: FMN-binding protein [Planctomycetes bacterium]|nr:FMN-binding protein [Planctomycetota bacterium]